LLISLKTAEKLYVRSINLDFEKIKTIKDLKNSGYRVLSVKEELRINLIKKLQNKYEIFPGIIGYDETVIPEIQNAVLSQHDFILLGLRGQAKTRILRNLVNLLDPYIPIIKGSEINDNPFNPISQESREMIKRYGDDTPIDWKPREHRYNEKLATPDVSIADLFGDIDPIKAASKKLTYADEGAIHFGIIPRTNRGIFVINELPDLQPRIQVGLLNVLEEKDLQIRGYPIRIPMDILIAFSANPEDYTNRGNIITPLKDRIDSQIMTHYPHTIEQGIRITTQEAWQTREEFPETEVPYYFREIIEHIAQEARESELIDQKSGVSARLPISCLEVLIGNAERRAYLFNQKKCSVRVSDLQALIPAVTGKIELVYEGEQEGVINVARILIGRAIKNVFEKYFPVHKSKTKDKLETSDERFQRILAWFSGDNMVCVDSFGSDYEYIKSLNVIKPLDSFIRKYFPASELRNELKLAVAKEFVLEALHQSSFLSKFEAENKVTYKDLVGSIFNSLPDDDEKDLNYFS
jgi:magnesium chelatase subunit I